MVDRARDDEVGDDQLLRWLRGIFVAMVRRKNLADFSMRQLAVLLVTYSDGKPQTAGSLATALGVSRPAAGRALDRLSDHGFCDASPIPRTGGRPLSS